MTVTNTTLTCMKCGGPLGASSIWIGGDPYHYACAPFVPAVTRYVPSPLTEDDVRRIVREELDRRKP